MKTPRERFDEKWKLDVDTGCWLWTAAGAKGRPLFRMGSSMWSASRAAHALAGHPIPGHLYLYHQCGRSQCVNPDHTSPAAPNLGCNNPRAVLDAAVVTAIRADPSNGFASIASEHGVTPEAVGMAVRGKTWRSVT